MEFITHTYRDWKILVDVTSTKKDYANQQNGTADQCGCDDCKNFVVQRDVLYPEEIKLLFEKLGIDYRKENETSLIYTSDEGLDSYFGDFDFYGNFEGKDCMIPAGESGFTFELEPITENFSIGFTKSRTTNVEKSSDRVTIFFSCQIPRVYFSDSLSATINANLNLISISDRQGLHKSKFIDESGAPLENSDSVIQKMLDEDLIETETNNDIYFLTPDGYACIEDGGWFDSSPNSLHENEKFFTQDEDDNYDPKSFSINYERPTYLGGSRTKFWMMLFLAAAAVTAFNYYNLRRANNTHPISPEMMRGIEVELDSVFNKK